MLYLKLCVGLLHAVKNKSNMETLQHDMIVLTCFDMIVLTCLNVLNNQMQVFVSCDHVFDGDYLDFCFSAV